MSGLATLSIKGFGLPKRTRVAWDEIILTRDLKTWQDEALVRLLNTSNLSWNWDSYGSPPPTSKVIDISKKLLTNIDFDELPVPNIVPVSGGGIQIEWDIKDKELEFEILPDGSIEFLESERGQPIHEGNIASTVSAEIFQLFDWLLSK